VRVILDQRRDERRQGDKRGGAEKRKGARRIQVPRVERALSSRGLAVVSDEELKAKVEAPPAAPPPPPGRPSPEGQK